jgi:hypothetical protein
MRKQFHGILAYYWCQLASTASLLDSSRRLLYVASGFKVTLHPVERTPSSMRNYFKYCIDVAVVAEHGLN